MVTLAANLRVTQLVVRLHCQMDLRAKAEVLIVLYGTSVKQCEGANLIWSSLLHECFSVQHEANHQTGGLGKAKVGFDARYEIYHCHLPS